MRLVIRASSLSREVLSQSIVGEFDERGGTIGRSDSNTMTLPDPERHVSRLQAELTFSSGAFSVRNVGSSNPIIVNGRPIGPGEVSALRHDDSMVIGGYELHVSVETSAAGAPKASRAVDVGTVIGASAGEHKTKPPRLAARAQSRKAAERDPFADLVGAASPSSTADPFADLLGAATAPAPASSHKRSAAAASPPAVTGLPDDFDPFADLGQSGVKAPSAPSSAAETFEDLVGVVPASGSIDTLFGLGTSAPGKGDAIDAFLNPKDETGKAQASDLLSLLAAGDGDSGAVGPGVADDTPELQAAYKPPPIRVEPSGGSPRRASVAPVHPPPRNAHDGEANDESTDALWDAFCEGAHLQLPARQRLTPDLMRLLGATLRQAVEGSVALSAVRTTAKQELLVPVTIIHTKNNNPLKFAPDAAAALAAVVQPPMRGFMAGPEAMQDLMADLLGHAVGTMAGTRAAIEGMLKRFEPDQLEKQLSKGRVLQTLVPMNRRAKLWELYLEHYGRISEAAREDFQGLFGKAFVKAYEEQADQVAAARRSPN